jgi:hypothetical protein
MARKVRQIYPESEVASLWAHHRQDSAKIKTGNFYFLDSTIYSYGSHFPIAKHFTAPNGEDVILFTTRTHSSTTFGHVQTAQRAALRSGKPIVYCYDVTQNGFVGTGASNMDDFKRELDSVAKLHAKARQRQAWYARDILMWVERARRYCETMCLEIPSWALLPDVEHGEPLMAALRMHTATDNHI